MPIRQLADSKAHALAKRWEQTKRKIHARVSNFASGPAGVQKFLQVRPTEYPALYPERAPKGGGAEGALTPRLQSEFSTIVLLRLRSDPLRLTKDRSGCW